MISNIIKGTRIQEIIIKCGFLSIGAIFALADTEVQSSDTKTILTLSIQALIGGIGLYATNSYFGYEKDKINSRLKHQFEIPKPYFAWTGVLCTFSAIYLATLYSTTLLILAITVFAIWFLYVHPATNLKAKPYTGIFIAFIGEICLFLIGYEYITPITSKSIVMSLFFGGLMAAGHLFHEIMDFDADYKSGDITTAILYGKTGSLKLFKKILILNTLLTWVFFSYLGITFCLIFSLALTATLLLKHKKALHIYRRAYLTIYVFATILILLISLMH